LGIIAPAVTGPVKTLNGVNAQEYILLLTGTNKQGDPGRATHITQDMWLAPEGQEFQELESFAMKLGQTTGLGDDFVGSFAVEGTLAWAITAEAMGNPNVYSLYDKKRLQKVYGNPNPFSSVRTGMAAGVALTGIEISKLRRVPLLQVTRIGSTAGGKPLPAASEVPELGSSVELIMETTTEITFVSSAPVGASEFEIPKGFKQIQAGAEKPRN
jgi:hypothetical protein